MITGTQARKIALNTRETLYECELLVAENVRETLQALDSIITSYAYRNEFSTRIMLSFKGLDGSSLRPINSFENEALVTSLKHYGFNVSCNNVRNYTDLTISW